MCSHAHEAAPKAGDVTHPSTSWDMMIGKLILTSWTIYHARHLRTGELRSCCFCLCLFILPVIAEPHSYGVFCLPIFFTYLGILVHHTTVCGVLYRQSGIVNTSIFITLHHSETNKMTSQERGMIPHEAKGLVNTTALHCSAAREEAALEKGRGFSFCFFSFSFWLISFKERGEDGRMFCIVGWSHCVVWMDSIWWSCATAWGYISDWWVSLIAIFLMLHFDSSHVDVFLYPKEADNM